MISEEIIRKRFNSKVTVRASSIEDKEDREDSRVYLIGVYLMGVYHMGVHLTGVHLTGICLMGVYLISVIS